MKLEIENTFLSPIGIQNVANTSFLTAKIKIKVLIYSYNKYLSNYCVLTFIASSNPLTVQSPLFLTLKTVSSPLPVTTVG